MNEAERIIAYLLEQGVLREAMFYDGYVAKAEYLDDTKTWQWTTIDLPANLDLWQPKEKKIA